MIKMKDANYVKSAGKKIRFLKLSEFKKKIYVVLFCR